MTLREKWPAVTISHHAQVHESTHVLHLIGNAAPTTAVLVIAEKVLEDDIRRVLSMGAAGILLEETAAEHISWALSAIMNGCRVLSPEISESVISEYIGLISSTAQEKSARDNVNRLSRREKEVLQLLGSGMSNRAIATTLFISPETVKDHVRAICSKLDVSNRLHAARVAWLAGSETDRNAA